MKMLVIEIFNIGRGNKDFLRIASQPFRCDEFNGGRNQEFRASNGFYLSSCSCPELNDNALYLRGREKNKDNTILTVPNRAWLNKLAQAVREYNMRLEETGGIGKNFLESMSKKEANISVLKSVYNIEECIE